MPTIASVLEPKLTALQARLEAVKTRLHTDGAFPGMTAELASATEELQRISGLAELLVIEVHGGLSR